MRPASTSPKWTSLTVRESAQQRARRTPQRVDGHAVEHVIGVRRQAVESTDLEAVVEHGVVVCDRGDVHATTSAQTLTTALFTTLSCHVCFWSSQSIHRYPR